LPTCETAPRMPLVIGEFAILSIALLVKGTSRRSVEMISMICGPTALAKLLCTQGSEVSDLQKQYVAPQLLEAT